MNIGNFKTEIIGYILYPISQNPIQHLQSCLYQLIVKTFTPIVNNTGIFFIWQSFLELLLVGVVITANALKVSDYVFSFYLVLLKK